MEIDKNTVIKIADLARLEVTEDQHAEIAFEMNKILTFMEQLNTLDTTGVEPLIYMNEGVNHWREDIIGKDQELKDPMENSQIRNEKYFMVPKILEK